MSRLVCAQHGRSPKGVQVPCVKIEMNRNEQISTSRGQGGAGDRVSERRLCETRKSMDKNHIEGRPGRVSWHNTAKPFDFTRQVNGAIVRGRTAFLPGEACRVRARQESAEVIVVGKMSRGRDARSNNDTGGLNRLRTELIRNHPTPQWGSGPMTPDGEGPFPPAAEESMGWLK